MTGPIQQARMERRRAKAHQRRESATPWFQYGPIPPRPEPVGTAEVLPTAETIRHYEQMPTLYGKGVAVALARMAVHRVPFTSELLNFLEAQEIRSIKQNEHQSEERKAKRMESKRRKAQDSWVYFIRTDGRVKIGVSVNVVARATSLSLRWTDIVAVIKGNRTLERRLHQRFAQHRIDNTEWFTDCPDIQAYIDAYAEPFSPQHPAYLKPKQEPAWVDPKVAYLNLARAVGGVLVDKQGGSKSPSE